MNLAESGRGGVFRLNPVNIEAGERPQAVREYFLQNVYGEMPEGVPDAAYDLLEEGPFLDSKTGEVIGIRTQVSMRLSREGKASNILLLLVTPSGPGPFPVIVSLNMYGNQSTTPDKAVLPSAVLSRIVFRLRERFDERHRGSKQGRVHVEKSVKRGYAMATAYYGDIMQDVPEGRREGLLRLYPEVADVKRKERPGALSVWASGISRIGDFLETVPFINSKQMIAVGHSRLGKALNPLDLNDDRFLADLPVAAGKEGTALSRSRFGEPLSFMKGRFGHWFSRRYNRVVGDPQRVPFDQDDFMMTMGKQRRVIAGKKDWWTDTLSQAEAVRRANVMREVTGATPIEFHEYNGGHEMPPNLWDDGILDFADKVTAKPDDGAVPG